MKVTVLQPITHGDKLHQAGEEVVLEQSIAQRLIEAGVAREVPQAKAATAAVPAKTEPTQEA